MSDLNSQVAEAQGWEYQGYGSQETEPPCNCSPHTGDVKNVTFHRWNCLWLAWFHYHYPDGRIETGTSGVNG